MKTYGVCNRQSARKHRRAGHNVCRFPDGRYMWSAIPFGDMLRIYQKQLIQFFLSK